MQVKTYMKRVPNFSPRKAVTATEQSICFLRPLLSMM